MSDSDNYFSDTDNEDIPEEDITTPNSDEENLSEYEMDEEMRRIIYSHAACTIDQSSEFFGDVDVPTKKKKSKKKKNSSNVINFSNYKKN